jgi:PIN domain nuclease of toxin-antitoxin system
MEAVIYLDTHVLVWLYAARTDLLSHEASKQIEENELLVSPMVLLELDYLQEIGKIADRGKTIYQNLHARVGLKLCSLPFMVIIESASKQDWTRDPFDRIIVGHAAAANQKLVTRDEEIQQHYDRAIW